MYTHLLTLFLLERMNTLYGRCRPGKVSLEDFSVDTKYFAIVPNPSRSFVFDVGLYGFAVVMNIAIISSLIFSVKLNILSKTGRNYRG